MLWAYLVSGQKQQCFSLKNVLFVTAASNRLPKKPLINERHSKTKDVLKAFIHAISKPWNIAYSQHSLSARAPGAVHSARQYLHTVCKFIYISNVYIYIYIYIYISFFPSLALFDINNNIHMQRNKVSYVIYLLFTSKNETNSVSIRNDISIKW